MIKCNEIYNLDCNEGLDQLNTNSVDLIVTDPPYGLSFMGKDWDKVIIPSKIWKKCYRVLKPGSFSFIMCSPRQDVLSRMVLNLQDSGFETRFTSIYWTYASGFPKALNISKEIDRRACKQELRKKLGRDPTKEEFKDAWSKFRNVIGMKNPYIDNGKRKKSGVGKGYGDYDVINLENGLLPITEPKTKEAKELNGSYAGYQPKPAVEIILIVMKPLSEGSYIEEAMKNRKGITWLNDCRIPFYGEVKTTNRTVKDEFFKGKGRKNEILASPTLEGRFPTNLIVSDDVLNDGKIITDIRKNNIIKSKNNNNSIFWGDKNYITQRCSDSGSFSKYFDLDSWFKEKLSKDVQKVYPFLIVPKPSKSEKNEGLKGFKPKKVVSYGIERLNTLNNQENHHPTVKSIKLMSYLITLGSRENDLILDPFSGSGTTPIACKFLNRKYICFEISKDYHEISKCRVNAYKRQVSLMKF